MNQKKKNAPAKSKRMPSDDSIDKYLYFARHELADKLTIIREGTSQVLDGLGNKDCNKCFQILEPALNSIDILNKLIEKLFNDTTFKSILKNKNSGSGEAELEKFKKELIGIISHVIRTPLTVIKEGLSLMLDEIPGKLNPKQKEIVMAAKENTDRLVDSIEKIFKTSWEDTINSIGAEVYYKT
ncbi:MAG: histidine kinase dimerization/phospho-acceptor domain-containing protein [Candidatus Omnitrophica bacterium]|nr:histidine kinase dimerization/phospho-acceptor domain-containing protein [Candidatus Omnitrophota bacterium]MDD5352148.1 histidine kinase dimerization/phospho-acceptor domain-containing protein [Candidatus Omnitrophota bacterium]MDD5549746.1 histidine kinase dimerization/phospho-acceptor domain-containing protein [Candidatus Omnitrophota bacterium]